MKKHSKNVDLEQLSKDELDEMARETRHCLEEAKKEAERLEKESSVPDRVYAKSPIEELFEELADDITEDDGIEQSLIDTSSELCCGDLLNLSSDHLDSLFDDAATSISFNLGNNFFNFRDKPIKLYPRIVCQVRYPQLPEDKLKMYKEYTKRIDVVMVHYQDEFCKESNRQSSLIFSNNIIPIRPVEEWNIPSGVPVNIPFYVLLHFLKIGEFSPLYGAKYENIECSQEEVKTQFANSKQKVSGSHAIPFANRYKFVKVGAESMAMFMPLSRIPRINPRIRV